MKNKSNLWFFIAIVAIIGLVVSGCDNNTDLTGSNPCRSCNVAPCACPTNTNCETCGEEPCECPTNTNCDICGEEPCICDTEPQIEDWIAYIAPIKAATDAERELALAERANVAARDTFRAAEALLKLADDNYEIENYADAAQKYIEAKDGYALARYETEEKRKRAEEAIKNAEEKVEESGESAEEAERIIEGGNP